MPHIHHFRAIAILIIVGLHCYSILEPGTEPYLLRRGTLPFMFISGFLFQYLSAGFNNKTYLKRKFRYVIIPYLVVSTPIIIVRIAAASHSDDVISLIPGFATLPTVLQVVGYYLTGLHLVPFWFIPMICFYYLLAPVFIALDRDKRIYYFLPFFIALSLVVTRAPQVYKIHLAFVHFLSVYLLGMFASRHNTRVLQLTDRIWPLLAIVLVIVLSVGKLFDDAPYRPFVEQFLYFQKLVFCWAIMYGFWRFDAYVPRQLRGLSDKSFGVFFLHYYLLFFLVIANYKGYVALPPTVPVFMAIFVADVAFCLVSLRLIKRVFGSRSRLLVGY